MKPGADSEAGWAANWRDVATYAAPKALSSTGAWRWEFIRRNPEYPGDMDRWNTAVDDYHQTRSELVAPLFESPVGQDVESKRERNHAFRERLRMAGDPLADLRRELTTKWGATQHRMHWPDVSIDDGGLFFEIPALGIAIVDVEHSLEKIPDHQTYEQVAADIGGRILSTSARHIFVGFDLNSHLGKQLASAKEVLLEKQKAAPKFRARDPSVLLRQLRVFDAVKSGEKRALIASVLHPETMNEYPDMHGDNLVGKDFEAANSLINFGFLSLHVDPPGD